MSAARWRRTDLSYGVSEILTIVRIDGEADLAVEVCSGSEIGDDFIGLFDLDGDQLQSNRSRSWEVVELEDLPAEVVEQIEGWAHGNTVVEPA